MKLEGFRSFYLECSGHHMGNKGDVAMLQSLILTLEKNFPGSRYSVPIKGTFTSALRNVEIRSVESLEEYILKDRTKAFDSVSTAITRKLRRNFIRLYRLAQVLLLCLKLKKTKNRPERIEEWKENIWSIKTSDAIFVSGGAYLNDMWSVPAAIRCGLLPLLGRILGKPVIFSGHGIGPLTKCWLIVWLRFCLKKISIFGLRERMVSPQLLRQLKIPLEKIIVAGDDAVGVVAEFSRQTIREDLGISQDQTLIGFNARLKSYNKDARKYFGKIVGIVKAVAFKLDATILFICSDFGKEDDDISTAAAARELLGDGPGFTYINEETTPERIKSLAGACDIVIAQSYHASVFALSSKVPAIGLYNSEYYADKTEGLFDFVEFPEGAIDLRKLEVDQIVSKIINIYHDNSIRERLEESVSRWEKLQSRREKQIVSVVEDIKGEGSV